MIIGILYARKKRKKTISPGFEFGTENNNMKRKENSLFDTSTGLFDDEKEDTK